MLSPKVCRSIDDSVLCWLATADEFGFPNVSPKEIFTHFEDRVLIAEIASPISARNLSANPQACVSFIDIFTQKGYKISGSAQVLPTTTPGIESPLVILRNMIGGKFQIKNILMIHAEKVVPILAPSYQFFPETTEESQRKAAYQTYQVSPTRKTRT